MPDIAIIDAHLHLYDPERIAYPWMAGTAHFAGPHLLPEFDAARDGVAVEGAIFVEVDAAPGEHLAEAEFVSGLMQVQPLVLGAVVHVPLDRGAETVAGIGAVAALPGVRGVRHLIQGHVDEPGWALREAFVEGVSALAGFGLSFDLCVRHPQLKDTIELVRRCPQVQFVLDHLGKPGIRAGLMEPWAEDLKALARHDNVWCKISGVVTEADHDDWREAQVLPYIRAGIDAFGFDRVMFGGDWPVSAQAVSYRRWVDVVDAATNTATPSQRHKLFRENARAFYGV